MVNVGCLEQFNLFCFKVLTIGLYIFTVANAQLRGANDKDAALIQQFVNFAENEILPPAATWVFPTYGIMQYNKQVCSIKIPRQLVQHSTLSGTI